MTNIKVQYKDIIEFLEANKGKKVSTIMDEITAMCTAKKGGSNGKTFIRNDKGEVTHVYCYYHKKWEDVTVAEYGNKKNTATGLNTMCKEGVSSWTKQQRDADKASKALFERVLGGVITNDEVPAERAKIEEARLVVTPRADGHGTDEV